MVDDAERRAGPLAAMLSNGGALIKSLTLEQTDLEDVFVEFSKNAGSDRGLCV